MSLDMLKCDKMDVFCEHCGRLEPFSLYYEDADGEVWCEICSGAHEVYSEECLASKRIESLYMKKNNFRDRMNMMDDQIKSILLVSEMKKIEKNIDKFAQENGYKISKYRDGIVNMIKRNDGYCPCVSVDEPKEKCPCTYGTKQIEVRGHCKCSLFIKEIKKANCDKLGKGDKFNVPTDCKDCSKKEDCLTISVYRGLKEKGDR